MAGNYQANIQGGGIGALLRRIQEEDATGPLATPPASEAGSPIRGLVQAPLSQSEAPDSSRVIATRPEVNPATATGAVTPTIAPTVVPPVSPVVAPVSPNPTPGVTAPVSAQPSSQPSNPGNSPSAPVVPKSVQKAPSAPSLSTSIRPSVLGNSVSPAPAKPSLNLSQTKTAAPAAKPKATPSQSRVGPLMVQDLLKSLGNPKQFALDLANKIFSKG